MWHDIWHEQEIFEILDQVVAWIIHRVGKHNIKSKSN